jgi:expansin (peptidoglycan-binding protein)
MGKSNQFLLVEMNYGMLDGWYSVQEDAYNFCVRKNELHPKERWIVCKMDTSTYVDASIGDSAFHTLARIQGRTE